MKISLCAPLAVACLLALLPQPTVARVRLGAQLGSTTGLSAQLDLTQRDALNLSLAYDLLDHWALIGADYRVLAYPFTRSGRWGVSGLYWGVGGLLGGRGQRGTYLSARLPLGVELQPALWRLQLFLEVAPTVTVLPATRAGALWALGARWTF
jgi:hypothetical protein